MRTGHKYPWNESPEGKFFDDNDRLACQGGLLTNNWGPAIASAATIAPTYRYHQVTGTTAIVTITPPYPGFRGRITFGTNSGIWTWTAAGNIFVAGTITAANGVPVDFDFDGSKWYPSRVT
jgi:hypothetical protein